MDTLDGLERSSSRFQYSKNFAPFAVNSTHASHLRCLFAPRTPELLTPEFLVDKVLRGHLVRMKIPRITMQQKPPKIAQPLTNRSSGRPAMLVATGIMFSRVAGLVRERALAHFLGTLPAADAFRAALRIPPESFRRRRSVCIIHPSLLATSS
jgi:hypothetical protein